MINSDFMGKNFIWWMGVVEDRNDPKQLGRCRVRILGYHTDNKIDIPVEDLPWAFPLLPITSASISGIGNSPTGPVEGTWIIGFFRDGNSAQEPVMMGTIGGIPGEETKQQTGFNDPRTETKADQTSSLVGLPLNNAPVQVTDIKLQQEFSGSINGKEQGKSNVSLGNVDGPITEASTSDRISISEIIEEKIAGNFPRKNLINEPDTNRLARGNTEGTAIEKTRKNVVKDVETAHILHGTNQFGEGTGPSNQKDTLKPEGTFVGVDQFQAVGPLNYPQFPIESKINKNQEEITNTKPPSLGGAGPDGKPNLVMPPDMKSDFPKRNDTSGGVIPGFLNGNIKNPIGTNTAQSSERTKWSEPPSPYNTKYPYNHVYETESGHLIEFDDTKGAERIHIFHRTGTFSEVHPDGSKVEKVVGKNYHIVLEDNHIHHQADEFITIDKKLKIYQNADNELGNNFDIEVGKGANLNLEMDEGNLNCQLTKGDVNLFLKDGTIFTRCEKGNIDTKIENGNMFIQVNGDVNMRVKGKMETVIDGDVEEIIKGNVNRLILGDVAETIGGEHVKLVKGNFVHNIGKEMYIKSVGDGKFRGKRLDFNDDK